MKEHGRKIQLCVFSIALPAILLLGSCAASMTLSLSPDGSGVLAVDARIPDAAAARLQSYRSAGTDSTGAAAPFFDAKTIRAQTEAYRLTTLAAETPTPNSFKGSFAARSLAAVIADPEIAKTGLIALKTSGDESTLSFTLSRENAEALPTLFPGIDPYILEALSPPALDPYPVTTDEYREMLVALLGKAAMKELDAAMVRIQVRTPGSIVRSSGGTASGQTFTATLPLLDMLVLEKPIAFSVSWK
jgi:hypothetical protein